MRSGVQSAMMAGKMSKPKLFAFNLDTLGKVSINCTNNTFIYVVLYLAIMCNNNYYVYPT